MSTTNLTLSLTSTLESILQTSNDKKTDLQTKLFDSACKVCRLTNQYYSMLSEQDSLKSKVNHPDFLQKDNDLNDILNQWIDEELNSLKLSQELLETPSKYFNFAVTVVCEAAPPLATAPSDIILNILSYLQEKTEAPDQYEGRISRTKRS